MGRGRTFSREFKLAVVQDVVSGAKRPAQVCREHGLSDGVLWRWRREVAECGAAAVGAREESSPDALERKIAELERFCGQLALENAALKKGLSTRPSGSGTR